MPLALDGCTIKVVHTIKDAAVELQRLIDYLYGCPATERLLGLDCEWLQGQKGSHIDLIQLCVGSQGNEDIVPYSGQITLIFSPMCGQSFRFT